MIKELDLIVLRTALPEPGLSDGDIGTVVMVYEDGAGYEVEFTALDGETLGITTLDAGGVRPIKRREIKRREIASARRVAA
jgi:hypothetical protein